MKKLCFASYAKILVLCKAVYVKQKVLICRVIKSFAGDKANYLEVDDATVSDMVRGKKNIPYPLRILAGTCDSVSVEKYFSGTVLPLLNANKYGTITDALKDVIKNDETIKDGTIIDIVSNRTKRDLLTSRVDNLGSFLAGVLIYVARNTDNTGSSETVLSITEEYINSFDGQYEITLPKSNTEERETETMPARDENAFDEDTNEKARLFCIEYEEDLHLLPLCEIAAEVHPEHKHLRPIFSAFIRQNKKTQKAILIRKSIKPFEFNNRNWIGDYVKYFENEINEKRLTSVNFLYEGAKYFHRAFDYHAAYRPEDIDPFIFKRKYVSGIIPNVLGNLRCVIDDYMYGKEKNPNDKNTPPFNILWYEMDLAHIEENKLTFWVCRFIVDVCHYFYGFDPDKEYDKNWKYKDCIECDKLETLEDLYYYALFMLYMSYNREK